MAQESGHGICFMLKIVLLNKNVYVYLICFYHSKGSQIVARWAVHVDKTKRAQFFTIYRFVHIMLRTSCNTYDISLAYMS